MYTDACVQIIRCKRESHYSDDRKQNSKAHYDVFIFNKKEKCILVVVVAVVFFFGNTYKRIDLCAV
jgi:hypothetical protein